MTDQQKIAAIEDERLERESALKEALLRYAIRAQRKITHAIRDGDDIPPLNLPGLSDALANAQADSWMAGYARAGTMAGVDLLKEQEAEETPEYAAALRRYAPQADQQAAHITDVLREVAAKSVAEPGIQAAFSPDQPRDADGKWSHGAAFVSRVNQRNDELRKAAKSKAMLISAAANQKFEELRPDRLEQVKRLKGKVAEAKQHAREAGAEVSANIERGDFNQDAIQRANEARKAVVAARKDMEESMFAMKQKHGEIAAAHAIAMHPDPAGDTVKSSLANSFAYPREYGRPDHKTVLFNAAGDRHGPLNPDYDAVYNEELAKVPEDHQDFIHARANRYADDEKRYAETGRLSPSRFKRKGDGIQAAFVPRFLGSGLSLVKKIVGGFIRWGWSKVSPREIDPDSDADAGWGAEQQASPIILTAYGAGMAAGYKVPEVADAIGTFTHHAVVDEKTSKICYVRHGLTLPRSSPYWLSNWPPLHYGPCRSVVLPGAPGAKISEWMPDTPAQNGFGEIPEGNLLPA